MAQAFLEACRHGTHPSYRARINIIGHSGAGKTSLTRRLLGQKFQKEEESTDGIETHRIEFDLKQVQGEKSEEEGQETSWKESVLKTELLARIFNEDVVLRTTSPNFHTEISGDAALPGFDDISKRVIDDLLEFAKEKEKHNTKEERTTRTLRPVRRFLPHDVDVDVFAPRDFAKQFSAFDWGMYTITIFAWWHSLPLCTLSLFPQGSCTAQNQFLWNHTMTFRDLWSRKELCDWTGTFLWRENPFLSGCELIPHV